MGVIKEKIAVCTGDDTFIYNDIQSAKATLISLYGEKLGNEAVETLKGARLGATYRKNGGPLVKVIDETEAEFIKEKEAGLKTEG